MNAMQIFKFNESEVRISDANGEPWFLAMDVAEVLGYKDAEAMTRRLDEDEKQNLQIVGFGPRGVTLISESGLYAAILGSKKKEAKAFQKWVTKEVLPTIRKTGRYELAAPISRAETKAQRREFADILKAHGYSKPGHYINTTRGMKSQLGIDPGKKKDTFSTQEYGAVFFAEMLASNTIQVSDAQGYHTVNPIAQNAAASVKALIEQSRRPALGAA